MRSENDIEIKCNVNKLRKNEDYSPASTARFIGYYSRRGAKMRRTSVRRRRGRRRGKSCYSMAFC